MKNIRTVLKFLASTVLAFAFFIGGVILANGWDFELIGEIIIVFPLLFFSSLVAIWVVFGHE